MEAFCGKIPLTKFCGVNSLELFISVCNSTREQEGAEGRIGGTTDDPCYPSCFFPAATRSQNAARRAGRASVSSSFDTAVAEDKTEEGGREREESAPR